MKFKKVILYSKVTVWGNNSQRQYIIVPSEEIDIPLGKISTDAPLGRALFGHKVNEIINAQTPRGIAKYKIVAVD